MNKGPRILPGFLLCMLASCPAVFAGDVHHYVFFGMDRERITEPDFLAAKGIAGAQLKYTWRQLEQGKDNYVFDDLRHDLAFLKSKDKKLFIQAQDSTFGMEFMPVPKYLREDPQYHGGVANQYDVKNDDVDHATPYGWVARRWDPAVRERFAKLLMALGKEFDGQIEGINLPKSAIDIPQTGPFVPKDFSAEAYRDGVIANMAALKQAFPKSVVIQYANFMPEAKGTEQPVCLRAIYEKATKLNVGMGGPDLLPYKPYQMYCSYPLIREFSNRVPMAIAVQDGNYAHVNPKTGKQVTLPEQMAFATDYLHVKYIFWCTQEPYYKRDVLPYFK